MTQSHRCCRKGSCGPGPGLVSPGTHFTGTGWQIPLLPATQRSHAQKPLTEPGSPKSACSGRAGCRTGRGCPQTSSERRAPARSPRACWRSRPGQRRGPSGNSCNTANVQGGSDLGRRRVFAFLLCNATSAQTTMSRAPNKVGP